jgi:NAD(P)-dependent dehydrogenase (short-subunit alcohol dehydrogenase family)
VLVTGGSRGIGAAVAQLAADRGYDVAVNFASDHEAAERVVAGCRETGVNARACQGNVAVEGEVLRVFEEAATLGPLTHVVNNAGITGRASRLEAASAETIRACIDLNVTGALLVAREAARRLS